MENEKEQGVGLKDQEGVEKAQINEFTDQDSLRVIRGMINISRKRLENNGILFIIWGWIMFITYLKDFIRDKITVTYTIDFILGYTGSALMIIGILLTIYFVFIKKKAFKSFIDDSLKFVWFSMVAAMVLTNLIIYNQQGVVDFHLQNPIFMVIIATALVVSGGILRYRLLIAGGVIFGILGYLCSYLELQNQFLVEAIAFLIASIIPGHILYSRRKKSDNV